MAKSTGIILVVGSITLANEMIFAPVSEGGDITFDVNWRIIPATLIAAALLGGIEQVSEPLAVGLAYISLVTVLFARMGKAPSPIENVAKTLGY